MGAICTKRKDVIQSVQTSVIRRYNSSKPYTNASTKTNRVTNVKKTPRQSNISTHEENTAPNTNSTNSLTSQNDGAINTPEVVDVNAVVEQIVNVLITNVLTSNKSTTNVSTTNVSTTNKLTTNVSTTNVLKKGDYKGQTATGFVDKLDTNAKVYVLGDLEGKIDLVYRFFIHLNLITYENKCIKWIGDHNTYVVQCGDQIDRNPRPQQDTDLSVILFFEFLYYISDGHVISVLGNHELLNLDDKFFETYTTHTRNKDGSYTKNEFIPIDEYVIESDRNFTFTEDNKQSMNVSRLHVLNTLIFQNILRYRHIAFKLDRILVSHAGILKRHIDLLNIRNNIGSVSTSAINQACEKQQKSLHEKCQTFGPTSRIQQCDICLSVWHRFFSPLAQHNPNIRKFTFKEIPTNFISVIGHNSLNLRVSIAGEHALLNKYGEPNDMIIADNESNFSYLTDKTVSLDDNLGYLVYTDVNDLYDPYDTNDSYRKIRYLLITKKNDNEFHLSYQKENFDIHEDNPFYHMCSDNFKHIFRDRIIPKLCKQSLTAKKGGGKMYKKTDQKVTIQGKSRVVYKYKNCKYVKWNNEYTRLSSFTQKNKKK